MGLTASTCSHSMSAYSIACHHPPLTILLCKKGRKHKDFKPTEKRPRLRNADKTVRPMGCKPPQEGNAPPGRWARSFDLDSRSSSRLNNVATARR